jgi:Ca2+-binding EF-hand superfamily protein
MKAFKYFDLNNNGTVEPEEFAKAIEKIGIMIPTRQVSVFFSEFFGCSQGLHAVSCYFGVEKLLR